MQFYHGTTKSLVPRIINSCLEPSVFSIQDYLSFIIKKAASNPPRSYEVNGEQIQTKWLGTGIYLFDIFNKSEAVNWRSRYGNPPDSLSECTAIIVEIENELNDGQLLDLFSYSGKKELKRVLVDKFDELLIEREDLGEKDVKRLIGLQEKIIESLDNLFENKPYLGGVAVDLYNLLENGKIKLVRAIYKKGNSDNYYDIYYCLKDSSLITSLNSV
ncbi:MAG: hypothetical protein LPK00_05725 [Bacillaceae bacterium]|nr:hypothetical protein [Bacillaceae bacterium]